MNQQESENPVKQNDLESRVKTLEEKVKAMEAYLAQHEKEADFVKFVAASSMLGM